MKQTIHNNLIAARGLLTLVLCSLCFVAYGQATFTWQVTADGAGELLLTISGTLDDGWHVSNRSLKVEQQEGVRPVGALEDVTTDGGVTYRQRFAVEAEAYQLRGYLRYVLCTDEACLAPRTVEFEHHANAVARRPADDGGAEAASVAPVAAVVDSVAAAPAAVETAGEDADFLALPQWQPVTERLKAFAGADSASSQSGEEGGVAQLLTFFFLAFAGGLLALLTPCVWPMIPLTVSFFMKRGEKNGQQGGDVKGAVLFGACIVVIFLVMGLLLTVLFGADALNKLSTGAVFNLVCFAVLTLFGLSLLGVFELRLPSSWADSLDRRGSAATGIVSIFFMAMTMVVVSFSCTAPVMGLLLVEIATASTGGGGVARLLVPMVGMAGFALALALPFTLFALFPKLLARVPRSGRWMTSVRVTLGFVELAFALKFLSVADLAYGWHILPRWLFISLWIALAFACGVYHTVDWQRGRVNPLRRQKVAMACYAFVFYLIPGLRGAPCTLVSAFLPPRQNVEQTYYMDYEEALAEARKQGKPLFIDFTGYGCVNCRKMEAAVFSDPRVRDILYNEYVVLQLYVDDRTPLPRPLTVEGRILRTVGDKWALLESRRFGSAAQPFYVITDAEGVPQTRGYAYDESVDSFIAWLTAWRE